MSVLVCSVGDAETLWARIRVRDRQHVADRLRQFLRYCLELPDDFFGGKFGVRLGREIIRRHETGRRLASDERGGLPNRGDGGAPMPRSALLGHNRKLSYVGHDPPLSSRTATAQTRRLQATK
jgi:hypothetical protein